MFKRPGHLGNLSLSPTLPLPLVSPLSTSPPLKLPFSSFKVLSLDILLSWPSNPWPLFSCFYFSFCEVLLSSAFLFPVCDFPGQASALLFFMCLPVSLTFSAQNSSPISSFATAVITQMFVLLCTCLHKSGAVNALSSCVCVPHPDLKPHHTTLQ